MLSGTRSSIFLAHICFLNLCISRYLSDPYLINGSKFDLRVYVYVSCYDPLKIYVFKEGLARFATCKYSSAMKHLSNRFMHLTNYRYDYSLVPPP